MPFQRTIACLANSKKNSGRCIAGKEMQPDGSWRWIRPVGIEASREITETDRQYENGATAQVLDLVTIVFSKADDHPYQAENLIIDPNYHWRKDGDFDRLGMEALLDRPDSLWEIGDSSYSGLNDRIASALLTEHRSTLFLIEPKKVRITVGAEGARFGDMKRKVRAHFSYNGAEYAILITDPIAESHYTRLENGTHELAYGKYFTVSLAEPYKEHSYKVVAAII